MVKVVMARVVEMSASSDRRSPQFKDCVEELMSEEWDPLLANMRCAEYIEQEAKNIGIPQGEARNNIEIPQDRLSTITSAATDLIQTALTDEASNEALSTTVIESFTPRTSTPMSRFFDPSSQPTDVSGFADAHDVDDDDDHNNGDDDGYDILRKVLVVGLPFAVAVFGMIWAYAKRWMAQDIGAAQLIEDPRDLAQIEEEMKKDLHEEV